ncbi:MAG: hypothetical protein ACI9F9_000560, partial [Candidatus Paceibacteria bacterium]
MSLRKRFSWLSVCAACGFGWFLLGSGSVTAQSVTPSRIVKVQLLSEGVQVLGAPITSSVGDTDEKEKEDEKPKTSDLLKALKKLVFDRRPSAILEAWSKEQDEKPVLPPDPEEEKKKQEGAAEAAVAAKAEAANDAEEEAGTEEVTPSEDPPAADAGDESDEEEAATPELTEDEEAAQAEAEEAAKDLAKEEKAKAKAAEKEAKAAKKEADKKAEEEFDKAKEEYKDAEKKLLEWELANFQRLITLSDWEGVRTYLASIEDFEAEGAYKQLLVSLVKGPVKLSGPLVPYAEKNFFAPEDLTGLAGCAPGEVENSDLENLAKLLRLSVDEGCLAELCLDQFQLALKAEDFPLSSAQIARVVIEARFPIEAGAFLPTPEKAIEENRREVLNLLTRHYLAVYADEKKSEHLEHAWNTTQAALADGEIEDDDKEEALKRAVAIAPDVRKELGQSWLDESFTERPERGMEILRVIGSGTSKGLFDTSLDGPKRLESLKLQTTAVDAVLKASPELANTWGETLNLLANNWLQEAVHSYKHDESTSRGPSVRRDVFGNVFYSSYNYNYTNRNIPTALSTDQLLEIRPSDSWLAHVSGGLRPKFSMVTAQLLLKMNEESDAFPYIERLAEVHPEEALDLVHEFLRVWTRNNNPNSDRSRTSQFMFIYGYDARGDGIPLTRSKQERNLEALAGWVKRLRRLPLEDIDEELIATAFTSAHSKAEVYQLETIERVFGDMEGLKPETLANLVEKMR